MDNALYGDDMSNDIKNGDLELSSFKLVSESSTEVVPYQWRLPRPP